MKLRDLDFIVNKGYFEHSVSQIDFLFPNTKFFRQFIFANSSALSEKTTTTKTVLSIENESFNPVCFQRNFKTFKFVGVILGIL